MMTRHDLYIGQRLLTNSGVIVEVTQLDYSRGTFTTRDPQDPSEANWNWRMSDVGHYFRLLPSDTDFYKELVKL